MELAAALHEAVWLVNGDTGVSVTEDVPSPVPEALANAILRAETFADPASRKPLLMRLAQRASDNSGIRRAVRSLLTGRPASVVSQNAKLFHDRSGNNRAVRILLRLLDRSWCAVPGVLVESLSQSILEALSVSQDDFEAVHLLLDDCLDKGVDWTGARRLGSHSSTPARLQRRCRGSTALAQDSTASGRRWNSRAIERPRAAFCGNCQQFSFTTGTPGGCAPP